MSTVFVLVALGVLGARCGGGEPADSLPPPESEAVDDSAEAISLLGHPLVPAELSDERRAELEANLDAAQAAYDQDPGSEEAIVWLGRRLAYMARYREAIDVYSRGLDLLPDSFRLLRHRGHRYISLRRFADAVVDLQRAAELAAGHADETEADGIPNALGVPLSTTQFNIWYHLGLAHYLLGHYDEALDAYRQCMEVSTNPDLLVATSDWMYMTLRRLGRDQEAEELLAPITADLEIVENDAYHRRLLMYKGEVVPEELLDLRREDDPDQALEIATQGYGVANWYLAQGDTERATEILERIVDGTSWAAFGFIAAEADLARMAQSG